MKKFIISQINQIKLRGFVILGFKIKKLNFYLITYFISIIFIPIFFIINLLKDFRFIRFGKIPTSRIGHLAFETDLHISNTMFFEDKKVIDIFCQDFDDSSLKISNKFLLKLFKRKVIFLPKLIVYPFLNLSNLFSIFKPHIFETGDYGRRKHLYADFDPIRDVFNIIDKTNTNLDFNLNEEKRGSDFLKRVFNGNINTKFVTLIVRDSNYLKKNFKNQNFSYHNYRDSNIDNYLDACEKLTEKGYFVFRMGSEHQKKIRTSNTKIIDYATNGMRSEFMDIYLGAKCDFCISTGTGWDAIPYIFRKPILFISYSPIAQLHTSSKRFITSFKHYYSNKFGRNLTMEEIFKNNFSNFMKSEDFSNNNIKLLDTSKDEIIETFLEMENFVTKKIFENASNSLSNENFFKVYNSFLKKDVNLSSLHGDFRGRVSETFLKKNNNFVN